MTITKINERTVEISTIIKQQVPLDILVKNRELVAQKLATIDAQIAQAKALGVKEGKDIIAEVVEAPIGE